MNVRKITYSNFVLPAEGTLTLPAAGFVSVTGANGSGKSSAMLETVAEACWGRSLRGASAWLPGLLGIVEVQTDRVRVKRGCSPKGMKKMEWNRQGEPVVRFDTTTKASDALAREVGSFEVWRRTHVFSSGDADNFSLASDPERKELLESLLGLECFDRALAACKADLKQAETVLGQAEQMLLRQQTALEGARRGLEGLRSAPVEPEPPLPAAPEEAGQIDGEWRRLKALRDEAADEVRRLVVRKQDARDAVTRADVAQRRAAEVQRLLGGKACPTCSQPISAELAEALRQSVDAAAEAAGKQREALAAVDAEVDAQTEETREELAAMDGRLDRKSVV